MSKLPIRVQRIADHPEHGAVLVLDVVSRYGPDPAEVRVALLRRNRIEAGLGLVSVVKIVTADELTARPERDGDVEAFIARKRAEGIRRLRPSRIPTYPRYVKRAPARGPALGDRVRIPYWRFDTADDFGRLRGDGRVDGIVIEAYGTGKNARVHVQVIDGLPVEPFVVLEGAAACDHSIIVQRDAVAA